MTQEFQQFWPHDLVAGEAVNVRPGDEDVSDLLGSIAAHGLLQPLVGRTREDETVEIIDGNRRLKALKQLFDEGKLREKVPVMLRDQEADADAFEISLAANILRRQLHPVVEFEAFVALIDKGKDKQAVADHFGIPLRAVEQRLALGRLHADVRLAWLEGRINGNAARAFTIASPADQAAYLFKVTYPHELQEGHIRRAFTKETVAASSGIARFVGAEAYRNAGGAFVPDLFAEEPDFADGKLLNFIADQLLQAKAEDLRQAEGWHDVLFGEASSEKYRWHRMIKPALPDDAKSPRAIEIEQRQQAIVMRLQEIGEALDLGEEPGETEDADMTEERADALSKEHDDLDAEHDRLDAELSQLTEAQAWLTLPAEKRAKAVAVLDIDREGKVTIARGFMKDHKPRPEPKPTALAAPAPKPSATGEEAPEPARLSAALLDELALTATKAAAFVLVDNPRTALAAMVASQIAYGTPLRASFDGAKQGPALPWKEFDYKGPKWGVVFRECLQLDQEALLKLVASVIARGLDFTSKAILTSNSLKPEFVQDLRCALPAEPHRAALVQAFDPAEYFSKAPKQEAIAAIRDCGDDPGKHAKLKKADLGAVATRLATERKWLPKILRGEVFDAVLPASEPEGDDQDDAGSDEEPAEPETPATAAEAALEIWLGQERTRLLAMKAPELREILKERSVSIPFGSTKMQLIELALQHGDPDSSIEEAA